MVQAHPREAPSGLVLYQVCSTVLPWLIRWACQHTRVPPPAGCYPGPAKATAKPARSPTRLEHLVLQLEAHHCVRTQCGTVDEIRQICSVLMVMDRLTPSPVHISSHVALTLAYAP